MRLVLILVAAGLAEIALDGSVGIWTATELLRPFVETMHTLAGALH